MHIPDLRAAAALQAALLDCACAFSPRVEDTATGAVLLDIEGLDRLFGSPAALAQQLLDHAAPLGTAIHVGIAANPDAAVCAARGWPGITILERGTEAARLKELRIDLLPLEPEVLATLLRWGVRTLGALAKLPARELATRLGQPGVHLHRLSRGQAIRPLKPRTEPARFEETQETEEGLTTLEPLAFLLHRMCEVLLLRLRSRGLAALELQLTLERERPHALFVLPLRLPVPARNPRVLTRLFMLALEAQPPGAAVTGIRLAATPSKPRTIQGGLFVPLAPEPEKLELTLARIRALVGKENVGAPALADSYARNRFALQSFGNDFGITDRRPHGALRLFRPALQATVHLRDGAPSWIGFSELHGAIAAASGPWQSSGDWWNGIQAWEREEWDVAVGDSLLRIYRDLSTGRWYAEGVYD